MRPVKPLQAEVFALAITRPQDLRQRMTEYYEPERRTLRQRVTVEVQIPDELLHDKVTNGEPFFFPVLIPRKGELNDDFVIRDEQGSRIPVYSYSEYLRLVASVLRMILLKVYGIEESKESSAPSSLPVDAHIAEKAALACIMQRGLRTDAEITDAVNKLLALRPRDDPVLRLAAELVRKLSNRYAIVVQINYRPNGRFTLQYERVIIPGLRLTDKKRKEQRPNKLKDDDRPQPGKVSLGDVNRRPEGDGDGPSEDHVEGTPAEDGPTPDGQDGFGLAESRGNPVGNDQGPGQEFIGNSGTSSNAQEVFKIECERLKDWWKWFKDRLAIFLGARPVNLSLSLQNAPTCQSFHLTVSCPEGLYLRDQEFIPDIEHYFDRDNRREALVPPYYRPPSRLGQPYAHFYSRFFSQPKEPETPRDGERAEELEQVPRYEVSFVEVPPGSLFRATVAALSCAVLIWIVGFILSHDQKPGSDAPAVLLAFPAVIVGWLGGFELPSRRLLEGTLAARGSMICTAGAALSASSLFMIYNTELTMLRGSVPFPVKMSFLGISETSWGILAVVAFLNAIYVGYRCVVQAWEFKRLCSRPGTNTSVLQRG